MSQLELALRAPREPPQANLADLLPAAVLVPIYRGRSAELRTIFTRRHRQLPRHPGEVSFPGGRQDHDDKDFAATALREAEEEIGLAAAAVTIVGALNPTSTYASKYLVFPFVGLLEEKLSWVPAAQEVEQVLDFSLDELAAGRDRYIITRATRRLETDAYRVKDTVIWGATARIVTDLLDRLNDFLTRGANPQ